MITVIHYSTNKDPDVYFGITETTEKKILTSLKKNWDISRSASDDWYGQDNPAYPVHHWNAQKRGENKR